MIQVHTYESYEELSKHAAKIVSDQIRIKPDSVLGLATGSSPVGLYRELIRMHEEDGLDFADVTSFNLDEYLGLDPKHAQSYRTFMNQNLFNHINIEIAKTHVPSGIADDIAAMALSYEQAIQDAGGIDLQILGIGSDGHIAFNEPGSDLDSRTRVVDLEEQTISDNARFFESIDDVPRQAITMGVGTILEAREIILVANGEGKSAAVSDAVQGDVSTQCTASALQNHAKTTFILDKAAAAGLNI